MLILIFQMLVNFSIVFCPLINNSSSLSAFDISVLTFVEYALLKCRNSKRILASVRITFIKRLLKFKINTTVNKFLYKASLQYLSWSISMYFLLDAPQEVLLKISQNPQEKKTISMSFSRKVSGFIIKGLFQKFFISKLKQILFCHK